MTTYSNTTNPYNAAWYHGTKNQKFMEWSVPPPRRNPIEVAHSGLFFTQDLDYAEGTGGNVCKVQIKEATKVIAPAQGGSASEVLRTAIIQRKRHYAHCHWLSDGATWTDAWNTGEVMRFAFDTHDPVATTEVAKTILTDVQRIKTLVKKPLEEKSFHEQAQLNLTRDWIEVMVLEAKKLGYQALIGAEIDQWTNRHAAPVSRSWLAVMDKSAISAPTWI